MPSALTLQQFRADLAEVLHQEPDEVDLEDNPVSAGLDSLRLVTLVERWEQYGIAVSFIDLAELPSFRHWWQLLAERHAEGREAGRRGDA
ncbi:MULTISPECIES: phosphopantetheine-binding protein [Streptomyces]|uniref:Phosphopantetheine attachment domain protein n=1 Tax=Streptomyces fungicidicus TaxID=68203 RepID=A0ACC7XUQ3_9ACTN|nr:MULTISPECIES: phosphopantetheine-binding protein [Streptomyces]NUV73389.1 phosphopantetheine attachment domain protein [Streptomyces fungicidicus]PAX86117.1 phosphopantetheine attachment domain protein [Streptomyces albidoflavus]PAX88882.1 phosphopantetheine attachment domain protein [Streptomyces albidoflavus]PBO16607.1 phosphopantetheine attachment domain protein [Streptomyces albidoflavus]PBO21155.1 phosphopantetheine attachment domain protein [Streptomyces albidoflavus]